MFETTSVSMHVGLSKLSLHACLKVTQYVYKHTYHSRFGIITQGFNNM